MGTPHVHILTPIAEAAPYDPAQFAEIVGTSARISCSAITAGPTSIESHVDEAMAAPEILRAAVAAAKDGADAIVVDCFGDPGLMPARESLSIPVVGPGMSSFHRAAMLADRFSVVTILDNVRPMIRDLALRAGLAARLCSVRTIDIPVLDLDPGDDRLSAALAEQALAAIHNDGAEAIILGCTGMFGTSECLSAVLMGETDAYIPVVDPISSAVLDAIAMARLHLSHSKLTYMRPPARALQP